MPRYRISCLNGKQVIVIIAPPPSVAYPFILDVEGYPQQIINLFIVLVRLHLVLAGPRYQLFDRRASST